MIRLNGEELKFITFPNGETKVDGDQIVGLTLNINTINFKYENDSDLIKLMFVKKFLDKTNTVNNLNIGYMPYSRMDREEGNSVFTLKYVAEFINNLFFDKVSVVEPHSDVCMALLDNAYDMYPTTSMLKSAIKDIGFNERNDYIFFPDAGAQKRYGKTMKFKNELVGFKKRNFQTGKIESMKVIGDVEYRGFKVIIVDDLSSYGGTFIMGAEQLKAMGASEIHLVVGHAENSIFEGKIFNATWEGKPLIDSVYTTDSILNPNRMSHAFLQAEGRLKVFSI